MIGTFFGYFIVNCVWASWSSWSACSITCGTGTKHRVRVIQTHEKNGGTCTGDAVETSQQNCGTCPAGRKMILNYATYEDLSST